ncbi:MAG: Two-component system sensor histidine kinase [Burkholderiaceae bacterium]|jgi:signal transduction histidine kinase|nr:MAG: Two-component system sensor histidine kinase [Burkholderiaceae bacterium]
MIWLWLLGLAVVALALINEVAYRRATDNATQRTQILAVLDETRLAAQSIESADSYLRLYVLTGNREQLQVARGAESDVATRLGWLTDHYRHRPYGQPLMSQLTAASHAMLAVLKHATQLRDEGRQSDALQLVSTDHSTDLVRDKLQALEAVELQRGSLLRDQGNAALVVKRFSIDLMALLTLLMLALHVVQSRKYDAADSRHKQELQQERDLLEQKVHSRTAELAGLALHLQTVREDERGRISRELHDELGALLTAAKIDLEWAGRCGDEVPHGIAERLRHVGELLDRSAAFTRRVVEDLRPSALVHLGLAPALENLGIDFSHTTGIKVATDLTPVQLTESGRVTAYRIVQESLTNVARHAQARQVAIGLRSSDRQAVIVVQDDGQGFDVSSVRQTAHGLRGMLFRVESEGGRLRVDSRPGAGTRIEAQLPLRAPEAQAPTAQH